jgi:hypothetical protein
LRLPLSRKPLGVPAGLKPFGVMKMGVVVLAGSSSSP